MTPMELIVLHGSFIDEVLIEIVLPLSIFGGLYWWSSRREKKKKKGSLAKEAPPAEPAVGRGERAPAADAAAGRRDT